MKEQRRCKSCQYLYTRYRGFGKCWQVGKTTDLNKRACRHYKAGVPYLPKLNGKLSKIVPLDPEEAQSWIYYTSATQALVVAWTTDVTGKRCWELKLVGLKEEGGLHTKQFLSERPAFYGDIAALGAGQNALWTSYGYEDADEVDEDGVVKNKVRVLRLYPAETRTVKKGGKKHGKPT